MPTVLLDPAQGRRLGNGAEWKYADLWYDGTGSFASLDVPLLRLAPVALA